MENRKKCPSCGCLMQGRERTNDQKCYKCLTVVKNEVDNEQDTKDYEPE